jgi:hypothetical protein
MKSSKKFNYSRDVLKVPLYHGSLYVCPFLQIVPKLRDSFAEEKGTRDLEEA